MFSDLHRPPAVAFLPWSRCGKGPGTGIRSRSRCGADGPPGHRETAARREDHLQGVGSESAEELGIGIRPRGLDQVLKTPHLRKDRFPDKLNPCFLYCIFLGEEGEPSQHVGMDGHEPTIDRDGDVVYSFYLVSTLIGVQYEEKYWVISTLICSGRGIHHSHYVPYFRGLRNEEAGCLVCRVVAYGRDDCLVWLCLRPRSLLRRKLLRRPLRRLLQSLLLNNRTIRK